jgi:L-ascorbate metabolism protein UlaG (beta-lactamase superfamily)
MMIPRAVVRSALVAAIVSLTGAASPQQGGVEITFLANEGVMLSGGGKKVIIDGLFQFYGRGFALPADSTQAALRAARTPFDSVDLLLVTHRHGDHFHPEQAAAHLLANRRATLLASQQVVDSMRGRIASFPAIAPRAAARTVPVGAIHREEVNGIKIEILGLKHHDLQHFGYIVEIGGRRVLHVGDTDDAASAFARIGLDTLRVDIALLPAWMGQGRESRAIIDRWVRPRKLAFFHFADVERDTIFRDILGRQPGATIFHRSLERVSW